MSANDKVAATFHDGHEERPPVGWEPTVREGDSPEELPIEEWIGQALGAASMCWRAPKGVTGSLTFDSTEAARIAKALERQVRLIVRALVAEGEQRLRVQETYLRDALACKEEHLTYGEGTLFKVRAGLRTVLGSEQVITDCITGMQNEGLLFRERT